MSQPKTQAVPNTLRKRRSMDLLRQFTRTPSGSSTPKPSSTPPSPYSLSRPASRTSSLNNNNTTPQPPRSPLPKAPQIPHTDALPEDQAGLEALLNENTVQLQRLADRVESVNEWMETDQILLARLLADQAHLREKRRLSASASASSIASSSSSASPMLSTTPTTSSSSDQQHQQQRKSVRFSSLLLLPVQQTPSAPPSPLPSPHPPEFEPGSAKEEDETDTGQILELKERIQTMKRWRKELERVVVWQREEGWRVMERMKGGKRDEGGERGGSGGEGWAVGGKTWERGSGRVPSQGEWEGLFAG